MNLHPRSFAASAARNTFFNANNYVYWASNAYVNNTHHFVPANGSVVSGFGWAIVYAILSCALGLSRGNWMTRVRR